MVSVAEYSRKEEKKNRTEIKTLNRSDQEVKTWNASAIFRRINLIMINYFLKSFSLFSSLIKKNFFLPSIKNRNQNSHDEKHHNDNDDTKADDNDFEDYKTNDAR
jgi:hypothetical protein